MPKQAEYVEIEPNIWKTQNKKGVVYIYRDDKGRWIWKAIPAVKKFNKTVTGKAHSYTGATSKGTRALNLFLY